MVCCWTQRTGVSGPQIYVTEDWSDWDSTSGDGLTCPAVIVSREELNAVLATVVICPLTSTLHPTWPNRVQIRLAGKDCEVAVDQNRAVKGVRLKQRLGQLAPAQAADLRDTLRRTYAE